LDVAAIDGVVMAIGRSGMSGLHQAVGLAVWVAISFLPAWIGSRVTDPSWYQALDQPGWAPPAWLFGPVWSVLYLLMGVAAWVVWRKGGFAAARVALTLFLVQLVFNAAWSWIFFGLRRPDLAFVEIVALWLLILATAVAFWKEQRLAGPLLVPYLLWVTYAAALNLSLWRLNA
jgi:translocator protein